MTPIPIPDACVPEGCVRIVVGPPDGDPTGDIRSVEAVAGQDDDGPRIAVLVELDEGDLERLADEGAIWLTFLSGKIPPFMVEVADGQG